MFTEQVPPDVAIRCDGCGEVWYFTADEPLRTTEDRDDFVVDCMETLEIGRAHV